MTEPITGDAGNTYVAVAPVVCANPFPIVLAADLADKDHPINDAKVSNKELGAMCFENSSGVLVLAIAAGPGATDAWLEADGVVTIVTPS
jgi:hypothetical protein